MKVRQAATADYEALVPIFEQFYAEEGFAHALAGVATALMNVAAEWAAARGCRDMEVVLIAEAQAGSLPGWYAARGFADTGRRILERPL